MAVLFRWDGDLVLVCAKATAGCFSAIRHEPGRMQKGAQPVERTHFREQSGHGDAEFLLLVISAKDHQMEQQGKHGHQPRSNTAQPGDPPVGRFRLGNVQDNGVREINRAPQQAGRVFVALPPSSRVRIAFTVWTMSLSASALTGTLTATTWGMPAVGSGLVSSRPVGVSRQSLMAVRIAYSRSLVLVLTSLRCRNGMLKHQTLTERTGRLITESRKNPLRGCCWPSPAAGYWCLIALRMLATAWRSEPEVSALLLQASRLVRLMASKSLMTAWGLPHYQPTAPRGLIDTPRSGAR
jgi:hypothetical protein